MNAKDTIFLFWFNLPQHPNYCVPVVSVVIYPATAVPKPKEFWAWAVHVTWVLWLKPQMLLSPPDWVWDMTRTVLVRDSPVHSN